MRVGHLGSVQGLFLWIGKWYWSTTWSDFASQVVDCFRGVFEGCIVCYKGENEG